MPHETPLIATIVAGLGLAFIFGLIGQRLRLPPIAGYLMAGVVIGPFTPGYVANQGLAAELAEIGVILLMFGVGLHFSLKELLSVRRIAVPGAVGQIAVATLFGMGLAWLMDWNIGAGVVFGLTLSTASTVVLLRAMQEWRLLETERGRIAVGWLIVEDLAMVLTLVLIPPLAGLLGGVSPPSSGNLGLVSWMGLGTVSSVLLLTAVKVALFVAIMLVVGRRVIPWILHFVAHSGSRELFRLSALAIALGVAYGSAKLFGVSFALGAFFAGMVLAESHLSTQAAKETLPLRDAFAVLFFVSVGMLFDPSVLVREPLAVIATILIIVVVKSAAAYLIVRAFGYRRGVALTIAASLAQIGEFAFILAVMGVGLQIIPPMARDLVVAGALISILLNPFLFILLDRYLLADEKKIGPMPQPAAPATPEPPPPAVPDEEPTTLADHAVLVGYGRVGQRVAAGLKAAKIPFLVIEEDPSGFDELRAEGIETFRGVCGEPALLERVNLPGARWVIAAIPDAVEAGTIVEIARAANPAVKTYARAHSSEDVAYLRSVGADIILMGEEEIARGMVRAVVADEAAGEPPQAQVLPPAPLSTQPVAPPPPATQAPPSTDAA